ncbi:NACHT domain-containing protein [Kitasatospora sp. NPDC094011]|uniref:NACHT domain-containing protein n=1 Tax=Kitasatospora sp. NPDC094011 TaxID=3364090 RepID=UPI00380DDD3E
MTEHEPGHGATHIRNVVTDSTVHYLVQIGVLNGDLHLTVPPRTEAADTPLGRAEERLARSLLHQWRAEADAWEMADPEPLAVRWVHSRTALAPGTELRGRGDRVDTMAGALLGLDHRRLLILGGAGAGKTTLAVLLTLELLARRLTRGEDVPVPVLLSLESWDAERVNFHDWLIGRVTEEHPGLPRVDGLHPARRLVSERRLLPVLDSLDELPEHRRIAVLRALGHQLGGEGGVVLICRTEPYRALVDTQQDVLRVDSAIEALPLDPTDVASYLRRVRQPSRAAQWAPLLEELRSAPDSPVSRALSTPLMVWLLRRGYERAPADPGELLDRGRFANAWQVEQHLLDRIVPASFPPLPPSPDRLHPPRPWEPRRARVWLSFLARLMNRQQTAELAWWRLFGASLPRALTGPALIAVGIVLSVLFDQVLGAVEGSRNQFGYGSSLGLGVALAGVSRTAGQVWFGDDATATPRRRVDPLRFAGALRSAGRNGRLGRAWRLTVVIGGPPVVLALGLWQLLEPGTEGIALMAAVLLSGYLTIVLAAPSDTVDAATPDALLRSERTSVLVTLLVLAPLLAVGAGLVDWSVSQRYAFHQVDWIHAAATWCGAAATFLLLSPWSRWLLARCSLALAGRLPWPLMTFLRDAHRAGLLQRTAGTYRFRNLRLQQHLAGRAAAGPGGAGASVAPVAPVVPVIPAPRATPGGPAVVPGPATVATGPLVGVSLRPASAWRGITVRREPGSYLLSGRIRTVMLAHWAPIGALLGLHLVRITVSGAWDRADSWKPLLGLPALGLLVMLISLLRRRRLELHITDTFIAAGQGRFRCRYEWADVAEAALRPVHLRGRDTRAHGIHVRLRPGAPVPPERFRGRDGWYLVQPMTVLRALPPDLVEALEQLSGGRWRPPGP